MIVFFLYNIKNMSYVKPISWSVWQLWYNTVLCVFLKCIYLFSFFLVVGLLGEIIISVRQHDLIKQEQKWNNVKLKWQAEPHLYLFVSAVLSHKFPFLLLLQEQLPDLWSHFQNLNLEAHMYASQWFLTLFTAKFPLCMVFHITDLLLCEVTSVHLLYWLHGERALVYIVQSPVRRCSTVWKQEISWKWIERRLRGVRRRVLEERVGCPQRRLKTALLASLLWCGKCSEVMYAASSASC